MNKKLIIALIAFALVLTLTIAGTYAYFTASASSKGSQQQVNVKTGSLGITYTHGTAVNLTNTALAEEMYTVLPIEVTNNGSVFQSFDIMWDTVTTNTLEKYVDSETRQICDYGLESCELTQDFLVQVLRVKDNIDLSTINSLDLSYLLEDAWKYVEPLKSIDSMAFLLSKAKSNSIITPSIIIGPQETAKYLIYIYFDYSSENQDYQQGKEFVGNIKVGNVEMPQIEIGSSSDWSFAIENDFPTITSFIGDINNCPNIKVTNNYWTDDNLTNKYKEKYGITLASEMDSNVAYDVTIPNVITDGTNYYYPRVIGSTALKAEPSTPLEGLSKTKSLTIPEGIVEIDGSLLYSNTPFDNYYSLSDLHMSYSLSYVEDGMFFDSSLSGDLVLSENLTHIGYASYADQRINGIEFNNELEYIFDVAFAINDLTGQINLPVNIKYIGEGAFRQNPRITSFNFVGINSTKDVKLKDGWNEVSDGVFAPFTCDGNPCL